MDTETLKPTEADDIELDIKLFQEKADQGIPSDQYMLGFVYQKYGNLELAKEYYTKAADQGYLSALHALGSIYKKEGNIEQAEAYYKQALDQWHIQTKDSLASVNQVANTSLSLEPVDFEAQHNYQIIGDMQDLGLEL